MGVTYNLLSRWSYSCLIWSSLTWSIFITYQLFYHFTHQMEVLGTKGTFIRLSEVETRGRKIWICFSDLSVSCEWPLECQDFGVCLFPTRFLSLFFFKFVRHSLPGIWLLDMIRWITCHIGCATGNALACKFHTNPAEGFVSLLSLTSLLLEIHGAKEMPFEVWSLGSGIIITESLHTLARWGAVTNRVTRRDLITVIIHYYDPTLSFYYPFIKVPTCSCSLSHSWSKLVKKHVNIVGNPTTFEWSHFSGHKLLVIVKLIWWGRSCFDSPFCLISQML